MTVTSVRNPESVRPLIEDAARLDLDQLLPEHHQAILDAVSMLNEGHLRVVKFENGGWTTLAWAKQAVLLYFKIRHMEIIDADPQMWVDKIPLKSWTMDMGVRVVPPATVRYGAFVAKGAVLMPCYVNIGAHVDSGSMIDTWATVGSCAQVGKNVHISGGVGLGGVLEPVQAAPVIVEDNCFIGSRAIVVEGVLVKTGAVLGAGVVLTASTPIVDVRGAKPTVSKGVVPENSVVIPGTMPKKFPAGEYQVPCALVIGTRSANTDLKTSLNQALRDFGVAP